jgi:hypothetical protein
VTNSACVDRLVALAPFVDQATLEALIRGRPSSPAT